MPKVTAEHMQARRKQILDAAINCFIRKGIHQTSMKDICSEAGLSIGAIYIHFKNKEEIIEATWKQYLQSREDVYKQAYQTESYEQEFDLIYQRFKSKLQQPNPDKSWQLWVKLLSEATIKPNISDMLKQSWEINDDLFLNMRKRLAREKNMHVDEKIFHILGRIAIAVHDGLVLQKVLDPDQDVHKYYEVFMSVMQYADNLSGYSETKKEAQNEPIERTKN